MENVAELSCTPGTRNGPYRMKRGGKGGKKKKRGVMLPSFFFAYIPEGKKGKKKGGSAAFYKNSSRLGQSKKREGKGKKSGGYFRLKKKGEGKKMAPAMQEKVSPEERQKRPIPSQPSNRILAREKKRKRRIPPTVREFDLTGLKERLVRGVGGETGAGKEGTWIGPTNPRFGEKALGKKKTTERKEKERV